MDEEEQYEALISGKVFLPSIDGTKRDTILLLFAEAVLSICDKVDLMMQITLLILLVYKIIPSFITCKYFLFIHNY